jgi:general secretion pathway protein C
MKNIGNIAIRSCRKQHYGRASVPALVATALALVLILRLGLPLWAALDPKPAAGTGLAAVDQGDGNRKPDLAALQSLALFDSAAPAATQDTTPTLNTSLNLHLEGVILAGEPRDSLAVIASGDQRGSYRTGENLPAGANIRVDSIARDHVVIDNRGQREVLWLFTGRNSTPAANGGAPAGTTQLNLPPGTDERVVKTAARLAEIITVTPEQSNGNLIGYRLAPGARLKDFVNLGLEEGDIVTAVDGIALNDMANLPKLYSLMDGASEVSFSLLRNGTPLNRKVTLMPETSTR